MESLDPILFRQACGRFTTGVTIVTASGADGSPQGFTANSFTSVSLSPPMLLFCIDYRATMIDLFVPGTPFAIHVLHTAQRDLSIRFATKQSNRFEGLDWKLGSSGAPIIPDSLAIFECDVAEVIPAGDHAVVIGNVQAASYVEGEPLLYFASRYRNLEAQS